MGETLWNWLRGRQVVTIPQLQVFSGHYTRAKELLQEGIDRFWFDPQARGLEYRVNEALVTPRHLNGEERARIAIKLDAEDLQWLAEIEHYDAHRQPLEWTEDRRDALEKWVGLGLAREFCGRYFLNVDPASVAELTRAYLELPEDAILRMVAHPILCESVRTGQSIQRILRSAFIPEECKRYIREKRSLYRQHRGQLPACPPEDRLDTRLIRFEMLEAFLRSYEFQDKQHYVNMARTELALLEQSALCPENLKAAARDAVQELEEKLTWENIQEILRILHG